MTAFPGVLWQIQLNACGRCRDFPEDLRVQCERNYGLWTGMGKPGQLVICYSWPNGKGAERTAYEIRSQEEDGETKLYQIKLENEFTRSVRRLTCSAF